LRYAERDRATENEVGGLSEHPARAEVAELADAPDSGSGALTGVRVQIPASAPSHHSPRSTPRITATVSSSLITSEAGNCPQGMRRTMLLKQGGRTLLKEGLLRPEELVEGMLLLGCQSLELESELQTPLFRRFPADLAGNVQGTLDLGRNHHQHLHPLIAKIGY